MKTLHSRSRKDVAGIQSFNKIFKPNHIEISSFAMWSVRRDYRYMRQIGISKEKARRIIWELLFEVATTGIKFIAGRN